MKQDIVNLLMCLQLQISSEWSDLSHNSGHCNTVCVLKSWTELWKLIVALEWILLHINYAHFYTVAERFSCPNGFELIGSGCYSFSNDRMGWIEAKKMCELKESRLVVIETEKERDDILEHVIATQGRQRSRFEFWTAGNDIDVENVWVWSGQKDEIVPEFGWIELPIPSAEENCLTWDITVSRGGFTPRGREVNFFVHCYKTP